MADYGFSADNLMRALPAVLREDEKMRALAQAVAEALSDERTRTRGINMYARIMTLPNGLLDILAHDFKVDWWDTDMTLLQKRRVLAASWAVHRTLGTAGAVKTALSSVFAGAEVREWYEYGGEAYGFKVDIDISDEPDVTSEKVKRAIRNIDLYKNLRSHLGEVHITQRTKGSLAAGAMAESDVRIDIWPRGL